MRQPRFALFMGALVACVQIEACGGDDAGNNGESQDGSASDAMGNPNGIDGTVSDDANNAESSSSSGGPSDTGTAEDTTVGDTGASDAGDAGGTQTACAELAVPLAAGSGASHFMVVLPTLVDLSGATISAEVYAPGATAGVIQAYVQQNSGSYTQTFTSWKSLSSASSWTTFSWQIPSPAFVTGPVAGRIGLSVETGLGADASAAFEQPETLIYVKRITATLPDASTIVYTFDTSSTLDSNGSYPPAGELWLNTGDSYVAGSSLAFDPVCGQPVVEDAGSDGAVTSDGGNDGSSEAGSDAASEAGSDAASEAGSDAASEAGSDAQAAVCPPGLGDAGTGGCAVLSVPLTGTGQRTWYLINLPGQTDFTTATITAQIIAPQATAGVLQAFIQNNGTPNYNIVQFLGWKNLSAASAWETVSWTVSATNAQTVGRLGFSVESGGATDATTFEQSATVVYINEITVTLNPDASTATVGPYKFPNASSISATQYAQVLWLDTGDTHVTGSTLSWLSQ